VIVKTLTVVERSKETGFHDIFEGHFGISILGITTGGKLAEFTGRNVCDVACQTVGLTNGTTACMVGYMQKHFWL